MRSIPEFNFPTFFAVESALHRLGWDTRNPARNDCEVYHDIKEWPGYATGDIEQCPKFDFYAAMRWDLLQVMHADAICLLPGWENSTGARHEKYVADIFKLTVVLASPVETGWAFEGLPR